MKKFIVIFVLLMSSVAYGKMTLCDRNPVPGTTNTCHFAWQWVFYLECLSYTGTSSKAHGACMGSADLAEYWRRNSKIKDTKNHMKAQLKKHLPKYVFYHRKYNLKLGNRRKAGHNFFEPSRWPFAMKRYIYDYVRDINPQMTKKQKMVYGICIVNALSGIIKWKWSKSATMMSVFRSVKSKIHNKALDRYCRKKL